MNVDIIAGPRIWPADLVSRGQTAIFSFVWGREKETNSSLATRDYCWLSNLAVVQTKTLEDPIATQPQCPMVLCISRLKYLEKYIFSK